GATIGDGAGMDLLVCVERPDPARVGGARAVLGLLDPLDPLGSPDALASLVATGATLLAFELVPRTTRAQAVDVLSSQASLAGYQAALEAAALCDRIFPMLTTAAGTIRPANVLVLGAGVAGLQAIATARRLGAVVCGFDVPAAAAEQVESLGASFRSTDRAAARVASAGRVGAVGAASSAGDASGPAGGRWAVGRAGEAGGVRRVTVWAPLALPPLTATFVSLLLWRTVPTLVPFATHSG